jgi:GNAT superfamily N-acetyltransferase
MKPEITLRQATTQDAPLFYKVIDQTMREFIVATWGAWDEERVVRESMLGSTSQDARVIRHDGEDVGVFVVHEEPSHFQVQQLYLLRPYQGQGIGTQLITSLLQKSAAAGKPVRLRVLKVNSAKQFYEKLGFTVTDGDAAFFEMESSV